MGLPFVIVEGSIVIVGTTGIIADVVTTTSGNRLKVETIFSPDGLVIPTIGNNLIFDDFNVANGGVARNTTISTGWTKVYEKTGLAAGLFQGFLVTVENINQDWDVRLVVDGVEVFGANGLSITDVRDDQLYGYDENFSSFVPEFLGIQVRKNTFRFEGPNDYPIRIPGPTSSIAVYLRKNDGDKKFFAGLGVRVVL